MSCSILFCLANLYINVELSAPQKVYDTPTHLEGYFCGTNVGFCKGPQATVKIGMPIPVGDNMLIYYGFKHTSFPMEVHDKGQNSPFVSFTWVPFK